MSGRAAEMPALSVAQASFLLFTERGTLDAYATAGPLTFEQLSLFEMPDEHPPLHDAISHVHSRPHERSLKPREVK